LARPSDSARPILELRSPPPPPKPLAPPPSIRVRVARDRTAEARATGGFLNLARLDLVAVYPDGTESHPFAYDVAGREALDAVGMAAYFVEGGVAHLYLRSAVRPPCALRSIAPASDGLLWEVPAGLVEPGEAPAEAAARELGEELGFAVTAADMKALGPWTFPVPGMIAERHIYFAVEVDPKTRETPTEDGSALERGAVITVLSLPDVLEHCRRGAIRDAKTELVARRLAEALASSEPSGAAAPIATSREPRQP
jgi:ADP-ribose pyrophosphatase